MTVSVYVFGRNSGDVVSVIDYLETIPKENIKALVNCQDKYGRNALHQVAEHGYEDIEGIKALITAGADPAFVNENSSQSFAEKMVAQEKVEILRLLSGESAQDEARPIATQPGPSPEDTMRGAHTILRDGSRGR